jgi:hypothetical protein
MKIVAVIASVLLIATATFAQSDPQVENRINKALPKAIVGTSIFAVGELLGWTVVYPKDKALEDTLFDRYDETTGRSVTMQERSEQVMEESMKLMLLGLPLRAMSIAGVTTACVTATKSTNTTKSLFDLENVRNPVWAPYIAGWGVGLVGSMLSFTAGVSGSRGPLTAARALSVTQSCLWGVAGSLAIVTTARNRAIAKQSGKLSIVPTARGDTYGIAMDLKF